MPTVFITGANRGLGLEFARQYLDDGWDVIATCRNTGEATALKALAGRSAGTLAVHGMAVDDDGAITALATDLSGDLSGQAIDVLINNAGVMGPRQSFGELDSVAWAEVLRTNVIAPLKVAEAFVGHVARSDQKKIVTVSSKMGSMADNTSGGSFIYRSSKAGVNAAMRSLSFEVAPQGIASAILHPGWVRTDMGGPNGLIDATESVSGMRSVIAALDAEKSGRFWNYDGTEIPW